MTAPRIDPALGLDLVPVRTLSRESGRVSVVIPAHNEEPTIAEVVADCRKGLELLRTDGEVVVSASGCTDNTDAAAANAGARVIVAPLGKGAAVKAGLAGTDGDIVCLVDGDMRYFGDRPLVTILVDPILHGIADATISDLYWRPLYPQMWLCAFFAPLVGALFPELLPKCGSTPWSGQRAARRELWPAELPDDFTVDLELLMHWNTKALRLRPVLSDDWVNPQRPKPDLMPKEFDLVIRHALAENRVAQATVPALRQWFNAAHRLMATYRPGQDQPQEFEGHLLTESLAELRRQLTSS
jgi:glycosyltransferase involved in cell wall biosynthesis